MLADPVRIAVWSGPRNISTALMRSWESRGDCAVSDEPLYGHYLTRRPDVDHPGRDEVIAAMECDWRPVAAALTGPVPGGKPVWYQKHMAHHLLSGVDRGWVWGLTNCFLIRDPSRMLTSLIKVMPGAGLGDTGLPQQVELFEEIRRRTGRVPVVVDSADVVRNPRGVLSRWCERVGVAYTDRMLSWAPGPRATDGVWARHWYAAVERSTGFEPERVEPVEVPAALRTLYEECLGHYRVLHEHRL